MTSLERLALGARLPGRDAPRTGRRIKVDQ